MLLTVRIVTKLSYFSKTFYPILFQNAAAAMAVMSPLKILSVYPLKESQVHYRFANAFSKIV